MKQPEPFSTDKPLQPGTIYLIEQGKEKRAVSAGSAKRMKLSGEWKIIKEFKDEIIEN